MSCTCVLYDAVFRASINECLHKNSLLHYWLEPPRRRFASIVESWRANMDDPKPGDDKQPRKGDLKPQQEEQKEPIAIEEPIESGDPDAQPV
jgi:hypothetical protein